MESEKTKHLTDRTELQKFVVEQTQLAVDVQHKILLREVTEASDAKIRQIAEASDLKVANLSTQITGISAQLKTFTDTIVNIDRILSGDKVVLTKGIHREHNEMYEWYTSLVNNGFDREVTQIREDYKYIKRTWKNVWMLTSLLGATNVALIIATVYNAVR